MKNKVLFLFSYMTFISHMFAQNNKSDIPKDTIKWYVSVEAGAGINFFVFYDEPLRYNEQGYLIPEESDGNYRFLQKNPLGTYWGIHVGIQRGKNLLLLGYSRSRNVGKYQYEKKIGEYMFKMDGFNLTHLNNFYSLILQRDIKGKHKWYWMLGVYYLRLSQNEIFITNKTDWLNPDKGIYLLNRNYKEYGFEDGGIIGGISFTLLDNPYYNLSIQAKVFYSTSNIWELASFGPVINFKL